MLNQNLYGAVPPQNIVMDRYFSTLRAKLFTNSKKLYILMFYLVFNIIE